LVVAIVKALFESDGHVYRHPETKQVIPSVTQLRDHFGLGQDYSHVDGETMQLARDLGTEVDNAICLIERGFELDQVDERVMHCIEGYLSLKEKFGWKPTLVHNGETGPAISEVNGMPVAFCTDLVGTLQGEEAVVELKRTSGVGPGIGFQLSGYDLCLGAPRRRRVVFQLLPGSFRLHDDREKNSRVFSPQDYVMFQASLALYWFKSNRGLLNGRQNGNGNH
jgi:hypothetical protein